MRQATITLRAPLWALLVLGGSAFGGDSSLPDSRHGVRTAPLLLLTRPDVRADLRLDASQTGAAEEAIRGLYAKAQAIKGMKDEKAVAARRAIDLEQQKWLE